MFCFVFFRTICVRKHPNKNIMDLQKSVVWPRVFLTKNLCKGLLKNGGRNISGKHMFFSKGGGVKQCYRFVDFKNLPMLTKTKTSAYVYRIVRIEYDPIRTAWLSLVQQTNINNLADIYYFYILNTHGIKPNMFIEFGEESKLLEGNRLILKKIPVGTYIHSVEAEPKKGALFCRSAGTRARIIKQGDTHTLIQLSSGTKISVSADCYATVGIVSNLLHNQKTKAKAGFSRHTARRPHVRGYAKNPVDHPHGGRTNGGVIPKTPWGKLTRGVPTSRSKKRGGVV